MRRLIITAALVLLSTASADIDLACKDDVSYIIWSLSDKSTFITRVSGGFETVFLGDHTNVSLAIVSIDNTDYLAAACTNEIPWHDPSYLMVIDTETLNVLNSRKVTVEDFGFEYYLYAITRLNLEKHDDDPDSHIMVGSLRCCAVEFGYPTYLASCRLNISNAGPMEFLDTLSTEVNPYAYIHDLFGPVTTQELENLSITSFCANPVSYYWCGGISSHLHEADPDTLVGMLSNMIYYVFSGAPIDLGAMVAGSGASEAMTIWKDTAGLIQYSVFTDSIAPDFTDEFLFNAPTYTNPVAMSCNPEDPGLLLAWYDNPLHQIKVRHYQDEWNDFDHMIASCPSGVSQGNIAVYSVSDGYYVTWLPNGATQPELVFVDRDTVTGINDQPESPLISPVISISSNPFTECVSLTVENDVSVEELLVFDMSGRIVCTLQITDGESFHWDGCNTLGSSVSSGVYVVLGITGKGNVTARLVKL